MQFSEIEAEAGAWRKAHPEAAQYRDRWRDVETQLAALRIMMHDGWPNQTQAAAFVGVDRGQISRRVEAGRLETNGREGRACRVCPESLLKYVAEKRERERKRRF